MPGYLTSFMVLIEADNWLDQVVTKLGEVSQKRKLTPLENKIALLAAQAHEYIHFSYDPAVANDHFPPVFSAKIDNGIGSGMTQYAFAGAIGPDFPAAANILALNQNWVADTMHKGAPRRAFKQSKSTEFVLGCLQGGDSSVFRSVSSGIEGKKWTVQISNEYKKPMMAYLLGHLSSVATHVVVEPFINQWAWSQDNADRSQFVVQLDAQIAKAYFQRDDLHSGQSWTAYLPDAKTGRSVWGSFLNDPDTLSKGVYLFCDLYLNAFIQTYGGSPEESLCKMPSLSEITAKFPAFDPIAKENPGLGTALSPYPGYKKYFNEALTDLPPEGQKPIQKTVEDIKGLSDFLKFDYECKVPELDRNFLVDGYRNTRDWALSAGYDHRPWVASFIASVMVLLGSASPKLVGVTADVWSGTSDYSPPSPLDSIFVADFEKSENQVIANDNWQAWHDGGMFGNEKMYFDILNASYGDCGLMLFIWNAVLTGVPLPSGIPVWVPILGQLAHWPAFNDGIFGQGTDGFKERPPFKRWYIVYNDFISPIVYLLLPAAFPKVFRFIVTRWAVFALNVGGDAYEELLLNRGDPSRGVEGDRYGLRIWYLRLWMMGSYTLSSLLAFGVRAADDDRTDKSIKARDYLLALIFPILMIAYKVVLKGGFEGELVKSLTGIDWPSTDTDKVDATILPFDTDAATKHKSFSTARAAAFPVRVFENTAAVMKSDKSSSPRQYYPEDESADTAWENLPKADDQARQRNSKPSSQTYKLADLFGRGKLFAGLLAMAAVNYDTAQDKTLAGQIFKDWNLDFRTEDEWNDLMEKRSDGTLGLLNAAEQWWSAVSAPTPTTPSADAVAQLEIALGIRGGPLQITGQIEDRSVAPSTTGSAKIFLAKTPYSIVDGSGNVVATGTTDENGAFTAALPAPADYEVRVDGYQGIA
jgi:hypothetical protein